MKGFYESDRERAKLFVTKAGEYFNPHYHINVEIYLIKSGSYLMTVNEQSFVASSGSIVVADSYAVHGYTRLDKTDTDGCKIIIIPYEYLTKFNLIKQNRVIKTPHVKDQALLNKLLDFVDKHLLTSTSSEVSLSAVDYLLSLILESVEFEENKKTGSVNLIKMILSYIHQNFKSDITRASISKEFGYSEEHISRVFSKFLKTSISKYVNELRLDYVEKNKLITPKSLTELIFEAGFNSQRTYYRYASKGKNKGEINKKD